MATVPATVTMRRSGAPVDASDIEFSPGAIIAGRLRVVRQLGAGGFGAVYEVEHLVTRHHRALKLLHPKHLGDAELASRFLREASAAARIGNPHIAETFDAGELENGAPWLLMELLSGESLSDVLRWKPRQDFSEACRFMRDVALAVHAAHEAGIVHRDLKPDNLFVTQLDGKPFAKVLDFGMSKFSSAATGLESLTAAGVTMGTPLYMAPEQMRGAKDVDGRADTYSLGVILFEMLAGGAPFDAASFSELAAQKHSGITPRLEALRPDCPPALAQVVHRAMAVEPEQRHATARELAEALSPWVETTSSSRDDSGDDEIEETSVRARPVPERPIPKVSSTSAAKLVRVAATPSARAPEPTAAPKGPHDKPTSPAMPAWVRASPSARGLSDWFLFASVAVLLVVATAVAFSARKQPAEEKPAGNTAGVTEVVLTTTPSGAIAFVDGVERGKTPTSISSIPGRTIRVQLELDGYTNVLETFRVGLRTPEIHHWLLPDDAPSSAVEPEQLVPAPDPSPPTLDGVGRGTVRFVVKPWAEVNCAVFKDTTPFQDRQLPTGEYSCTFSNPEFPPKTRVVHIEANTTVKVQVNFLE